MSIQILYEDGDIILIDKPSGFTVNKAETTKGEETVQEWAEKQLMANGLWQIEKNEEPDFYKRAGIVHRLDKETSGILIIAKTEDAFADLQRQFKERTVQKTYIALVHGLVAPSEGEISIPVGRLPWNRKRFGVVAGGRESITRYITQKYLTHVVGREEEKLSLLELYPKTGRTHQIRVHLKHIGHPIFADSLYGGRKTARRDRKVLPRMFLHAAKISFVHPREKKVVTFESKLPDELQDFLKSLASV